MKLWALKDGGGTWGAKIVAHAVERGWETGLFTDASEVDDEIGTAFMRIAQHPVERTARDKAQAEILAARHFTLVPDLAQIRVYDSKLAQASWSAINFLMPRTIVTVNRESALPNAREIGFPLLSKSSEGSASKEIRMIANEMQLVAEADRAFGIGIKNRYALQRGYLILQEFLPGNDHDMRVCAVGRYRMLLRRFNRPDRPFASGSGKFAAVQELDDEARGAFEFAERCFASMDTLWSAIDLVRDRDGRWRLLESSIAYTLSAYEQCRFFDMQGEPSKYVGTDFWDVALDEIEKGAFA